MSRTTLIQLPHTRKKIAQHRTGHLESLLIRKVTPTGYTAHAPDGAKGGRRRQRGIVAGQDGAGEVVSAIGRLRVIVVKGVLTGVVGSRIAADADGMSAGINAD